MKKPEIKYAMVRLADIKGKLVRNSNYNGNTLSLNGWCWVPQVSTHTKPKFHEALCDSIRREGLRNPVIVYALPEGMFLSFGGSRVRAAREVGLDRIPAIVNDYTGQIDGEPVTEENWKSFFVDVPEYFEFSESGADTHYSIEKNRRHHFDKAGLAWCEGADWLKEEFAWISHSTPNSH